VLDTILSRAILIHFEKLSPSEMADFAQKNQISADDTTLQEILIAMAMGKPGTLLRLQEQITINPDLVQTIKTLT
jgi:DNA polymerase III gamma/tau subunit